MTQTPCRIVRSRRFSSRRVAHFVYRHAARGALWVVLATWALLSPCVQAHPHAWIDVRSAVVLDDAGRVAAIDQEWVFDEIYSASLMEGVADGRKFRPEMLVDYAGEVIENLKPYNYFMTLRVDGKVLSFDKAMRYQGELRGDHFVLSFSAPLAQPVDPVAQTLEFAVYDPTYFIQMMHLDSDPPRVRGAGAAACRAELHEPDPSPADMARAFAMDFQAEIDNTLGELFAQKVILQCR